MVKMSIIIVGELKYAVPAFSLSEKYDPCNIEQM